MVFVNDLFLPGGGVMTETQLKQAMFSSAKDDWTTPIDLFEKWDNVFCFNLDAASSDDNALCERHFTKADDGLAQEWGGVSCVAQPSVWTRNREVGGESIRRSAETEHKRCVPAPRPNRYKVVSRLLHPWAHHVSAWTVEVWRLKKLCTLSFNDCRFWNGLSKEQEGR